MFIITKFRKRMVPAVLALWKDALPHTPVSEKILHARLFDHPGFDPDGLFVAEQKGGEMAGFVSTLVPASTADQSSMSEKGYVTALAIRPGCIDGGAAQRLLARAEGYLRRREIGIICATACPGAYFSPGIDVRYTHLLNAFRLAGFEESGRPVDMETEWDQYAPPAWYGDAVRTFRAAGFSMDFARPRYHDAFLDFMRTHFPGPWYERALYHMESGKDLEQAVLAFDVSGKVAGFVRFGVDGIRGYIDSIGVCKDQRKKKIGALLLGAALQGMAERGARKAAFSYTNAVHFYKKAGARIVRRYVQFAKRIAHTGLRSP